MSDENFAESVFEGTVESVDTPEITPLESWDDVDSIPSQPEPEAQVELEEEPSAEVEEDVVEDEPEASDEAESEDNPDGSEDGEQPDESGEQSFELPEQLQEKGLVQSEDGDIGKMVKIDGEMQFVPLSELGNDYSGQQALQQRFSELDADRKQYKAELDEVNKYVNDFASKMAEGDALAAMQYLGEFAGQPPYQIKRQLIQQLMPEIQRMAELSSTELNAEYVKEENEYLQQSLESEREMTQQRQAQVELDAEVRSVREAHQINDSEWDQAISYLQEHEEAIRAANPDLVMDANFVAETILDARAFDRAESAFEAANVNLDDSYAESVMEQLHEIAVRNPDFTQDDLVELVQAAQQTAVESKVSKSLGDRISKHGEAPAAPKGKQQSNTTPEEDALLNDIWGF